MAATQAKIGLMVLGGLLIVCASLSTPSPSYSQNSTPTWVTPYAACPNAPLSQLVPGSLSIVNLNLKSVLNMRTKPALTAVALAVLSPGEWVRVLEGPQCADERVWWKVQSLKSGRQGWVAEGDSETVWLAPPIPTATPTPKPTRTPTITIDVAGTSQAIQNLSTATVAAGRARATQAALTATAFQETHTARRTATAFAVKAWATQAQQNAAATVQAYWAGKTATALAAPTRTAGAYFTATALRVTARAQATAALEQTQAARARATQNFGTVIAITTATAQARATLATEYPLMRYYKDLSCENKKISFWAHVAAVAGGRVRAYTSAPELLVFIDLQPGSDFRNLKPSATTYYLFLGVCAGKISVCAEQNKCETGAHLSEAVWLP